MAVLNLWGKLTKTRSTEQEPEGNTMAANPATSAGAGTPDAQQKKDRASKKQEKAAARAQKRESRQKRSEAKKQKAAESGRPSHLCSLATVDVKRGNDGFSVTVNGSAGRKSFTIAPNESGQVLRDLETAIQVMRAQL